MSANKPVPLHHRTIAEVGLLLRSGRATSMELTELMLSRIEALDPQVNAFITVTTDLALAQAHAADQELSVGNDRGPLHGIPVAVKDLFATAGIRTTGGSSLHKDWIPDHDSTPVHKLHDAGAVLLGKTNLHELAYGVTSINPWFGAVHNPWALDHDPGGSSGGSAAAVAAGLAYAALGTDTGCSVRQPAHCCGVVGHKPTFGLVSKAGVLDLVWSLDHVGPITRSVDDAAIVLDAIAGHDPADPYSVLVDLPATHRPAARPIADIRIGVVRRRFFDGHSNVISVVEAAIEHFGSCGATVVALDLPDIDEAADHLDFVSAEAGVLHEHDLSERPEAYSDEVRGKLQRDQSVTASDYISAQHFRRGFTHRVEQLFDHCDVLVAPTATIAAAPINIRPSDYGHHAGKNTSIFDYTGHPSISVPCGFTPGGLPVGLMLTGPLFGDRAVLEVASAFEQITRWHLHHPSIGG